VIPLTGVRNYSFSEKWREGQATIDISDISVMVPKIFDGQQSTTTNNWFHVNFLIPEKLVVLMAYKPATAQLVAPSNLEEGYVLDVVLDGKNCNVIVPPGGVQEGETFQGQVVDDDKTVKPAAPVVSRSNDMVRVVRDVKWRDNQCDFCQLGCCRPMCLLAWCCPWCMYTRGLTL